MTPTPQPLNIDNALSLIERFEIKSGVSSKTGNPYTVGTLYLVNGFPVELKYPTDQVLYGIRDALDKAQKNPSDDAKIDLTQE